MRIEATCSLPIVSLVLFFSMYIYIYCSVLLSVIILGQEHYINWLPMTFLFSHFFFFIVGLWTAQDKEGIIPVISVLHHYTIQYDFNIPHGRDISNLCCHAPRCYGECWFFSRLNRVLTRKLI